MSALIKNYYSVMLAVMYPLIDFLTISVSIMTAYKIYRLLEIGLHVYYEKRQFAVVSLFAAFVTVLLMQGFGVYRKESSLLNTEEIKNVIKASTTSFLLFSVVLVFGKYSPSRYVLVFSFMIGTVLLVVEKTLLYHLHASLWVGNGYNRRIFIYGAGELGQTLYRVIINSPKMGIVPVGFIDDDVGKIGWSCHASGFKRSTCLAILGSYEDIDKLATYHEVTEVFVTIPDIDQERLERIISELKSRGMKVSFVPNLYRMFVHRIRVTQVGGIPLVSEYENFLPGYCIWKRWIDLALTAPLLLTALPLMAVIAAAIRVDSDGPIFFRHERVGKDGRLFQIFKFRTMYSNADPYEVNPTVPDDPRITRVGRFLRRTSLDEIPQLYNVLKGEMSLVGPRPEMPFIVEQYEDIHRERLRVLPGITGLWQLSGDRKRAIHENMDYDLYYIKHMSFFLDLAILIETLIFAFRGT